MGIGKFDDTKILINTENKLWDDVTLKRVMILMTYKLLKIIRDFIHSYF